MSRQEIDITKSAAANAQRMNANFEELYGGIGGAAAKHLNILILGNSYSCDAWSYVPFILKEMGITCTIGIYYVAGQPISDMVTFYSTPPTYGSAKSMFFIDTRSQTAWETVIGQNDACTHECVVYNDTPWDIIAVQQSHTTSFNVNEFTVVGELIRLLISDMKKPFVFGWSINHVHGAVGDMYYISTLNNIRDACERFPVDIIFPCGTAIMDAQLNSTLNVYASNLLSSDGIHLNEGLPCYIAALANVEAILRRYYPNMSVIGDTTRPTASWLEHKSIPGPQGDSVGFGANDDGDENAYLAQMIAIRANNHPFERLGGRCYFHMSLEHCTWGGGSYTDYGAVTNIPISPETGYAITSCRWRRNCDTEWNESNFVVQGGKYYLQIRVTDDLYIEAIAEPTE